MPENSNTNELLANCLGLPDKVGAVADDLVQDGLGIGLPCGVG